VFDIGFWELAVIGVIALLVVGPDRLPALARNVGMWVGRIRRYVSHVKQDIERELHAEEMRELLEKRDRLGDEIRDVARETASVLDDARKELDAASRDGSERPGGGTRGAADASPGTRTGAIPPVSDAGAGAVDPPAGQDAQPQAPGPAASDSDHEKQPGQSGQR